MKIAMSRVSWEDVCWTECNVWWPWNIDWSTASQPECHQLDSPGLVKQQPIVVVVAVEVESHHVSFMAMVTFWNSLMLFLMVRASEILHKGSDAPSMSSPVVDEDRMRPGHWLESVLCVSFSAWCGWFCNRKDSRSAKKTSATKNGE